MGVVIRGGYRRVLIAAAVLLGAATVVAPGVGALEPVRAGWWSATNLGAASAPAPPDVPADGLHVAGGPNGPQAIAAVVYEVPSGAAASLVTLETTGLPPSADGLTACPLAAKSVGFKPAQNGAWADRPEFDCERAAVEVKVEEAKIVFPAAALTSDGLVAFALVPAAGNRVTTSRPGSASLQIESPPPSESSAIEPSAGSGFVAPVGTTDSFAGSGAAPPVPVASGGELSALPAPETPAQDDTSSRPSSVASSPISDSETAGWRTSVGGFLGFGLLFVLMLFYSQGRGLLGARIGS